MTSDDISTMFLGVAFACSMVNLSGTLFITHKNMRQRAFLLWVWLGATLADIVAFVFAPSWFTGGLVLATALVLLFDVNRYVHLHDSEPEDEVTA